MLRTRQDLTRDMSDAVARLREQCRAALAAQHYGDLEARDHPAYAAPDSTDCSSPLLLPNYDPVMLMAVMHTDDKGEC